MIGVYAKNVGRVWFGVACAEPRVFATSFANSEQDTVRCLLSSIPFNVPFQVFQAPSAFAENVLAVAKNFYDGNGAAHTLCLAMEHLSEYTRRVLDAASCIPLGYLTSYGAIAQAVGGSPRAVGNVMTKNPFAPIIPCHRVVSAGFTLGGYGGGLDVKLSLLKREKRGYASPRQIAAYGKSLQVFPVEFMLRKLGRKR